MRLSSFEVFKFRNVLNSGIVDVEPDVTCLVGKNEAGKSAILSAVHRLNPSSGAAFSVQDDYPRWLLVADRRDGDLGDVRPIRATFAFDDDDLGAVEELVGPGVLLSSSLTLERTYGGAQRWGQLEIDESRAVTNLLDARPLDAVTRDTIESSGFDEMRAAIRQAMAADGTTDEEWHALDDVESAAVALLRGRGLRDVVGDALIERVPVFFYFSDYSILPGRIDLSRVGAPHGADADDLQTAGALLRLAGTNSALLLSDDYESRRAELEAVSSELTRQVFEYWTQSIDLEVSIDVDVRTIERADGESEVGRFIDLRVHDKRHGYTGNFAHRSSGFRWFFSFLAAFSEFEASDRPVVVLLDEPALGLHARAQRDFLRFINERLASRGQVIYTTHSPYMIETDRLERVRIVEDRGPEIGSTVTADARHADPDSSLPIVAALSYGAAQLLRESRTILVDGAAAVTYLTLLSEQLTSLGRRGLDDRCRIIPTGGGTNLATFATLAGGGVEVTVLVDASSADGDKIELLSRRGMIDPRRIVNVAEVMHTHLADIEDLFAPADYLVLYNMAFQEQRVVADLPPGERVVARIAALRGNEFDQSLPADQLRRQKNLVLGRLSESTLQAFEQLFVRLDADIPPAPSPATTASADRAPSQPQARSAPAPPALVPTGRDAETPAAVPAPTDAEPPAPDSMPWELDRAGAGEDEPHADEGRPAEITENDGPEDPVVIRW